MLLRNSRHERFAQEIAAGKPAIEAYRLAGYRADRGNATHLQQKNSVAQRVDQLLAEREKRELLSTERAIQKTAITKERVLVELARLAFANVSGFVDADGCLDLVKLRREQAGLLSIKRAALVDLGKELGMFIERREQGGPGDFANMPDDQLAELVMGILTEGGIPRAAATAFVRRPIKPEKVN